MMEDVAIGMGAQPPTEDDIRAILSNLDEDSDGRVDKKEFVELIMTVLTNLLEDEEDLKQKYNWYKSTFDYLIYF